MEKNNDVIARLIVMAGLVASVTLLETAGLAKCVKKRLAKMTCCTNQKNTRERDEHVWF